MSNGWPERPLTPAEERDLPIVKELAREVEEALAKKREEENG